MDIADPRSHPKLPAPSYDIVRRGQVVRLPQVVPHPATVIAHTSAVRLGQLLYGAQWRPEGTRRPDPRTGDEILADAGGAGALAALLYRLPATGWQLALAAPQSVTRARRGLVTDVIEYAPDSQSAHRFHPIHSQQMKTLISSYNAVLPAEQTSAGATLQAAQQAGTPVPRAVLDAVAHRGLAAQPQRGGAQTSPAARRPGLHTQQPSRQRRMSL